MGSHLTATGRHLPYGITVLPATRHKRTRPALIPASKLVLDLPTLEGCKAELTIGYPGMHRPGFELAIFRSQVRRPITTYTGTRIRLCLEKLTYQLFYWVYKFCFGRLVRKWAAAEHTMTNSQLSVESWTLRQWLRVVSVNWQLPSLSPQHHLQHHQSLLSSLQLAIQTRLQSTAQQFH